MSAVNNENNPTTCVIAAGTIATDLADSAVMYLPKKSKILGLYIADTAGIPASDTDYVLVYLKVGSTTIATYDSRAAHNGALVANVAKAGTIVSGQETQEAGSTILLNVDLHGSAVITRGAMVLNFFPL